MKKVTGIIFAIVVMVTVVPMSVYAKTEQQVELGYTEHLTLTGIGGWGSNDYYYYFNTTNDNMTINVSFTNVSYTPNEFRRNNYYMIFSPDLLGDGGYTEDFFGTFTTKKAGQYYVRILVSGYDTLTGTLSITDGTTYVQSISASDMSLSVTKKKTIKVRTSPSDAYFKPKYSSANANIAKVNAKGVVTGERSGKTTITIQDKTTGIQTSINVTVTDYKFQGKPKIYPQGLSVSTRSKVNSDKVQLLLEYANKNKVDYYEIWRATKKDGNYKKVITIENNKRQGDFQQNGLGEVGKKRYTLRRYTDKGLGSNKQYFYKIRWVREVNGKKYYSKFSKPVSYWTSLQQSKVICTENSSGASWNRVDNADGYLVRETFIYFRGYNIFGKRLYGTYDKVTRTNSLWFQKQSYNSSNPSILVLAYTEHNGCYYIPGRELLTKSDMNVLSGGLDVWGIYDRVFRERLY